MSLQRPFISKTANEWGSLPGDCDLRNGAPLRRSNCNWSRHSSTSTNDSVARPVYSPDLGFIYEELPTFPDQEWKWHHPSFSGCPWPASSAWLGADSSPARTWPPPSGLDKLTALACVFFAAPLAVFGAEHLTDAEDIVQLIPAWMPARLFWAYFVGVALIAAGPQPQLKKISAPDGLAAGLDVLPLRAADAHSRASWHIRETDSPGRSRCAISALELARWR